MGVDADVVLVVLQEALDIALDYLGLQGVRVSETQRMCACNLELLAKRNEAPDQACQ